MQIYTVRMHTTEALIPVLRLLKRAEVDGVGVGMHTSIHIRYVASNEMALNTILVYLCTGISYPDEFILFEHST